MFQFERLRAETHIILYLNNYILEKVESKVLIMKNGQFAGSPCFGYTMSPDKTHFEIDPEAAKIVRLIFDMALAGRSRPEIVKFLNDHNVPTPAAYRQKQGRGKGNMITPNPLWDHVKVSKLLRQEAYTGKLIMRKHVQPVPCVKKYRKTSPEEQFVRENAHEPIVSQEEFDKIQVMMPRRKGWDRKSQREYPLKGLVRCGTCGKRMCITSTPSPGGFVCKESSIEHSICSSKVHPMAELEQTVYQKIMQQQQSLLRHKECRSHRDQLAERVSSQSQLQNLYRQQSQLHQEKAHLYEQYISGDLAPEDYVSLKRANAQQLRELEQHISMIENQPDQHPFPPASDYVQAARMANQYCNTTGLSREMAAGFVKQILLFDDRIDIDWKFDWLPAEGE